MTPLTGEQFSDAEIAGLVRHGFTVINNGMADLTVGDLTIAVLSGRSAAGLVQMIIKVPNGVEIFCTAAPSEIFGEI